MIYLRCNVIAKSTRSINSTHAYIAKCVTKLLAALNTVYRGAIKGRKEVFRSPKQ